MNTVFRYFFLVAGIVLAGCSDSAPDASGLSEAQRKEIHSAVVNRFHAMIKYAEAGELDKILSHFDQSGPGTYIDGPTRYNNFEDMAVNLRATWKVQKQDYGVPDTKIVILSPAYVLITSSTTLNTTNRDGTVFQPRAWYLSTLWMLKDGEWVIHSFHQSGGELKPVEVKPPA